MAKASIVNVIFGVNSKQFDSELKKVEKQFKATAKSMESIGKSLSMYVTAPLIAAGAASVKASMDFETSMMKIQNLVGVSADEIAIYTDEIKRISEVTGQSLTELGDGLLFITGAGLKGAKALEVLESSSKLAAIGMGQTTDIGKALVSVLAAYGSENISAQKASEVLLETVRAGNVEAATLAPTLGMVIPIAAQMGVSFEEVGASIAMFTRLGVSAEVATVGLRSALANMLKPSVEAQKALAEVGMTFGELRQMVQEKGLAQTLIFLNETFKGNDEAIARIIPDIQGLTAVLATAGKQSDEYVKVLEQIKNSTNNVDDAFKNVSETTAFKFKNAVKDLTTLGIEMGTVLLPIFNKLINVFKAIIEPFKGLNDSLKNVIVNIGLLAATLGPLIFIGGKSIRMIASMRLAIVELKASMIALNLVIKSNPYTVLAGLVASAAATLFIFSNRTKEAKDSQDDLNDSLKETSAELGKLTFNNLTIGLQKTGKGMYEFTGSMDKFKGSLKDLQKNELESIRMYLEEAIPEATRSTINETGNLIGEIENVNLEKYKQGLDLVNKELEKYTEKSKSASNDTNAFRSDILGFVTELKSISSINLFASITADLPKVQKSFQEMLEAAKNIRAELREPIEPKITTTEADERLNDFRDSVERNVNQAVAAAIAGSAAILGELIAQSNSISNIGKSIGIFLLDTLGSLAVQVGEIAIATGIAISGIKEALMSLNPITAIAAGIALVALGSFVKAKLANAAQSEPTAFADGGVVYGRTNALVGEYPGARSNPEVIAPLDKLTQIIQGSLSNFLPTNQSYAITQPNAMTYGGGSNTQRVQVEVVGSIQGKDIYLAQKRYSNTINRTT